MFKMFCIFLVISTIYEAQGQFSSFGSFGSSFGSLGSFGQKSGLPGQSSFSTFSGDSNPFNLFGSSNMFDAFSPFPRSSFGNTMNPFTMVNAIGRQIQDQVEHTLLPVKQSVARQSMMKGVGGVTVVNIPGLGLSLLMNEGIAYRCEGHIQRIPGGQPRCYGNSVLIQDVCIPGQNFLQFNNMKCFGENVGMYNGACVGGYQISLTALKERCGSDYDTNNYATYDYYPISGKLNAINLQSSGVACSNTDRDHCVFN